MSEQAAPKLNKLPFLAGDVVLLGVAAWLALRPGPPLDLWRGVVIAACAALAGWLGAVPFLVEYRAAIRLAEAGGLASTVEQIKALTMVGEQVANATARWQTVQEAADKTARTAMEIADQITTEARNFSESLQKARDTEVRNLRLEVEKLHRAESDWLQVLVRMLDHVYALYAAGANSGQPSLAAQLGLFQNACREAARRVGLTPLEAGPGTPFDERLHQVPEGAAAPAGGQVAQTIATGYSWQGQLLRKALVTVAPPPSLEAQPKVEAPSLPQLVEAQLPLEALTEPK
jgi:molecular chaperone GrpE (heat shock protein)